MAWRDWGNPPHNSTSSIDTGQSTSTPLAILSTLTGGIWEARWIVGGSSNAVWQLEHSTSASSAVAPMDVLFVFSAPNQSAEYVQTYVLNTGDELRARLVSTVTGNYAAHLSVEKLT